MKFLALSTQSSQRTVLTLSFALFGLVACAKAGDRPHPWLFLTEADVTRARQSVHDNRVFAQLAKELITRASTNTIEKLPPLERQWWDTARKKPWKEIYPEANHHTGNVPRRWSSLALDCARANTVSDAPELATKGRQILLRLSDYTFEFEHFDVGMNYAVWGVQALETYDILYDRFTDAERARIDAFFKRMLAAVQKNDEYWIEKEPGGFINNHYAWHKLCYVMLGAFYNQTNLIDQAFHGPKGIDFLMKNGFKDDGLWVEGSIHYQCVATEPLVKAAELLVNFNSATTNIYGPDLYAAKNSKGVNLLQSYKALIPLLWPDRTLPSVGDAYALRPHIATEPDLETLFHRFREPSFGWLLADRRSRSSSALLDGEPILRPAAIPVQTSKLWPEMGYIALRSNEGTNYWTGDGWSVFATYANRPIHQHADKLSISLFADGHLWLPDIEERPAAEHVFSSDVQSQLNRHTICHNTVLIDGENQRSPRQKLELVDYNSKTDLKCATFGDLRGQLHAGVRQLRTIIVTTDHVIDFFEIRADKPRQISWLTHVDGLSVQSSVTRVTHRATVDLGDGPPWSYLQHPRAGVAEKHFAESFRAKNDSNTFQIDLWSDNPMEIVECDFPLVETISAPTIPMRMARNTADHAWFLAVYRTSTNAPIRATVTTIGKNWAIQVEEKTYSTPQLQ